MPDKNNAKTLPEDILSPIEEVIEDARNGRMVVLVDAEDRENEGDLIIPAQMATPDAINFMAKYGRGLICMALQSDRAKQLNLEFMTSSNQSRHETAFTISIEAREGISTGISAHDRAHTISVAIDPTKDHNDIVSPGHVFPLIAKDGGVLVRSGHTEAACDIARLAGLYPSGVICEIMNEDGSMARLPDLIPFAQFHGLKIGTIADLIAYRLRYDNLVKMVKEKTITSVHGGQFTMKIYANTVEYAEHVALVKGDVSGDQPVLVRMHSVDFLNDVVGTGPGKDWLIQSAMKTIEEEGRGVIVLLRDTSSTALTDKFRQSQSNEDLNDEGPSPEKRLVEYGIGAQILNDLGVSEMILLSNTPSRHIVGLDGYGLKIVDQRPIAE